MAEEMPYYTEEKDWKKRFEITIPILLLILVFFVIAWKMSWLAGLPIIGEFFKGGAIDIAIIGNDQALYETIETNLKKDLPINTYVLNTSDLYAIRSADFFKKYSMIILTEGQNGDTIELETLTLEYLKSFVDSGKPAIVIGLAGSKVKGSPQESGWSKLGFVPVACKNGRITCEKTSPVSDVVKMFVKETNHPILKDFTPAELTFTYGTIKFTEVNPTTSGKELLQTEITVGNLTFTEPGLIERIQPLGGGKVIYYPFHPSFYAPLLRNTIKYLR